MTAEAIEEASYYEEVTPVSLAIAMVGAVLMLIAIFLPRVESNEFGRVAQNTLIQAGDGWLFIGLALGVAGWSWRAYHRRRRTLGPVVLGLVAIGVAIYDGTNREQLRLCSLNAAFSNDCSQASPSVGIYAAGVGGALAVIGGWQIWRARRFEWEATTADEETDPHSASASVAERLKTLESLRSEGLITSSEYDERRQRLLNDL